MPLSTVRFSGGFRGCFILDYTQLKIKLIDDNNYIILSGS